MSSNHVMLRSLQVSKIIFLYYLYINVVFFCFFTCILLSNQDIQQHLLIIIIKALLSFRDHVFDYSSIFTSFFFTLFLLEVIFIIGI